METHSLLRQKTWCNKIHVSVVVHIFSFIFSFGSNGLPYVRVTVRGGPKQHKQQAGHMMDTVHRHLTLRFGQMQGQVHLKLFYVREFNKKLFSVFRSLRMSHKHLEVIKHFSCLWLFYMCCLTHCEKCYRLIHECPNSPGMIQNKPKLPQGARAKSSLLYCRQWIWHQEEKEGTIVCSSLSW